MFTAANKIARKPKIFENWSRLPDPANAAIMAPTMITEEIAFVTDIKGVCNEGVTLKQHNIPQILKE